ncbi:MAG: DNA internalization-related competence protein ComEC/Rec2 [Woeseiaceae bacterium]|nr:DNA internalization-related competence protein ComEC/Rec2 [Woeseiaceae bacterium]
MKKACLYLLAGIYAPQLSSFASHSDLILPAVFAAIAGIITGRLLPVVCLAAGYLLFLLAADRIIDARIAAPYVGDSIVVEARVAEFPRRNGPTVSFVAQVGANPWVPSTIRVSWFEPGQVVRLGDVWRLELRLRRPRGSSNPGGFDYEGWLFRERIAATAYVVAGQRNLLLRSNELGRVDLLRQAIVDRLVRSDLAPQRSAVLAAITVGARHLLSAGQWERYARTGTSHLMAISGLHVGMVAAAGYVIGLALSLLVSRRACHHRTAVVTALGCALAYATLSGMAIPARRAALMIGIAALANLAGRPLRPLAILAIAAATLAACDPLSTMAPGFKLSFAAVWVLVWLASRRAHRRRFSYLRQLSAMQFALLLGLMPLTVMSFDRVAIAAPLVNLLAVPVFAAVTVPCALAGVLLDGKLQPAGDGLLWAATAGLELVEVMIGYAAGMPLANTTVASFEGWSRLWLLIPVAWVVLPPGWPCRACAWLAAAAIIAWLPARPESGCAAISVLDVGQGLSAVVETSESVLLYDTGPSYRGGGNAAESTVLPFLASRGIRALDQVVVSHSDLDHAGGLETILSAMPVTMVLAGEPLGTTVAERKCVAGDAWVSGDVRFEFLHPPAAAGLAGNDASCVLQVSAGQHAVLLPGDIERKSEQTLLRNGALRPVTAVIAPHHGSATSSSPGFVAALQPALLVVPAGFGNRWGLPDSEVVTRWQARGARVESTADSGAIQFTVCQHESIGPVTSQRDNQRRIWHE